MYAEIVRIVVFGSRVRGDTLLDASSYGDYVEITEDEARDSLAKAERFLSEAKRVSRSILEEKKEAGPTF